MMLSIMLMKLLIGDDLEARISQCASGEANRLETISEPEGSRLPTWQTQKLKKWIFKVPVSLPFVWKFFDTDCICRLRRELAQCR